MLGAQKKRLHDEALIIVTVERIDYRRSPANLKRLL